MDLRVFLLVVGVPTAGSLRQPARAGRSRSGSIRCAVSRAGPRLLLVDEADSMRNALQRYFEQRGFRCDAVATGHAALEMMARAPPPDVLITEVLISPESVDGLDLLHAVRADPRLCGTPVVLLTTRGLTSDRVAGFSAGASAYVSKPFDAEELVAIVRALAQNAMLARGALVGTEVHQLRAEVAQIRQLLQAVLFSTGKGEHALRASARLCSPLLTSTRLYFPLHAL